MGCDQQGRYPQAAECCTELGNEDDDGNSVMPLAGGRGAADRLGAGARLSVSTTR